MGDQRPQSQPQLGGDFPLRLRPQPLHSGTPSRSLTIEHVKQNVYRAIEFSQPEDLDISEIFFFLPQLEDKLRQLSAAVPAKSRKAGISTLWGLFGSGTRHERNLVRVRFPRRFCSRNFPGLIVLLQELSISKTRPSIKDFEILKPISKGAFGSFPSFHLLPHGIFFVFVFFFFNE
jgi:hypothetical protein